MYNINVIDSDPLALLPVNAQAAILEAFKGLERRVARVAIQYGYPSYPGPNEIAAVQYLKNIGVLSPQNVRTMQILKNVRDQAAHFPNLIEFEAGRKYLELVDDQYSRLEKDFSRAEQERKNPRDFS
jgi:hypothetical protein